MARIKIRVPNPVPRSQRLDPAVLLEDGTGLHSFAVGLDSAQARAPTLASQVPNARAGVSRLGSREPVSPPTMMTRSPGVSPVNMQPDPAPPTAPTDARPPDQVLTPAGPGLGAPSFEPIPKPAAAKVSTSLLFLVVLGLWAANDAGLFKGGK